jgi:eukaryotic-like serine/threonine-protein kinase
MALQRISLFLEDREGELVELYSFSGAGCIVLGREKVCDLALDGRGVSRRHCQVTCEESEWIVEDLGGRNGTIVRRGSEQIELRGNRLPLSDSDQLEIGETVLVVKIETPCISTTEHYHRADDIYATELIDRRDVSRATALPRASEISPPLSHGDSFRFLNYSVMKKIGEGGMGAVYLAQRLGENNRYAIKFLRERNDSQQEQLRFLREMEIVVKLSHPSIIECLESGFHSGKYYIVMPFCSGGDLDSFLARTGALDLRRTVRLLERLLVGVEYAHRQGVVHRDLKPSNILLQRAANGKYVTKIGDFGLAKYYETAGDSGMTSEGTFGGSWKYMAREQLTNFRFVTPQSDIWSLGAIAYECLTLQPPRTLANCNDPMRVVLSGLVTPIEHWLPDVPKPMNQVIMRALETDTAKRFKDAREMRAALRAAAQVLRIDLR